MEGALLLSGYAEKVYLIYGESELFRPDAILLEELRLAENIEVILKTNVVELLGDDGLEGIVLDREVEGDSELAIQGIFVEIGANPRVELAGQDRCGAERERGDHCGQTDAYERAGLVSSRGCDGRIRRT